ncbi:trypsin-like peptidase domain-containing protein [Vibrio parahaemolyticus]|nr:trypsin-like peptidase domain-containing protein [Vibrio parahaemolyticus]EME0114474.1 trypsin-like peptidase domain-containing protein [Vibrio parahaemolyticus]
MEQGHLDILKHNTDQVLPCITSILVYDRAELSAEKWLTGGTGFFVKTKERSFLVTAYHVYEEIEQLRKSKDISVLISGNGVTPFDISNWKEISSNKNVDIIVLEIPDSFDITSLGKDYFKTKGSNAERITVGESVFILGFPGEHRRGFRQSVDCFMLPIMDSVTGVSENSFTVVDEENERTVGHYSNTYKSIDNFGGMSGSPVLSIRNGCFELVGVFIEGGAFISGTHAPLVAAHYDLVAADGVIDETKIPPRF